MELRVSAILASVADAVFVLGAALLVTLVIAQPLTPWTDREVVPLHPDPQADRVLEPERVREQAEEQGLARTVEITEEGGNSQLVLEGIEAGEALDRQLSELLGEAGYRMGAPTVVLVTDIERILEKPLLLVPSLLAQALVFGVGGALLIRKRLMLLTVTPAWPALPAIGIGLAGGIVAFLASWSVSQLLELIGQPVTEQAWVSDLLRREEALLLLLPWLILILPVAEEIFFRGYMLRFLSERISFPAGFILSSLMFAIVHLNLSGFPVYLCIGAIFAAVYVKSSSLWAPATAHVSYNAIAILLDLLQRPPG